MHFKLPFIVYNSELCAFRIGPAKKQWVEVWWRSGVWCRPSEWWWGRDYSCDNGCVIIDCGWWGFNVLAGICKDEWDI